MNNRLGQLGLRSPCENRSDCEFRVRRSQRRDVPVPALTTVSVEAHFFGQVSSTSMMKFPGTLDDERASWVRIRLSLSSSSICIDREHHGVQSEQLVIIGSKALCFSEPNQMKTILQSFLNIRTA